MNFALYWKESSIYLQFDLSMTCLRRFTFVDANHADVFVTDVILNTQNSSWIIFMTDIMLEL